MSAYMKEEADANDREKDSNTDSMVLGLLLRGCSERLRTAS